MTVSQLHRLRYVKWENDELKTAWKQAVVACSKILSEYIRAGTEVLVQAYRLTVEPKVYLSERQKPVIRLQCDCFHVYPVTWAVDSASCCYSLLCLYTTCSTLLGSFVL